MPFSPLLTLQMLLRDRIAPQASAIALSPAALAEALQRLGDASLLALRVPMGLGGQGVSAGDYWQMQRAIARTSPALAFLQTQHQSAASFIASGQNEALKQNLSSLASGKRLVGVGFSHLRRSGPPCLIATPVSGGYRLNGNIPWATGWQFFQDLVAGAELPEGRALLALVPFRTLEVQGGCIRCSEPMALSAFAQTRTVSMVLENWFVADAQVIDHKPQDWLAQADRRNVLKSSSLSLGCGEAALDWMAGRMGDRPMPQAKSALQRLNERVAGCAAEILAELERDAAAVEAGCFEDSDGRYGRQLALRGRAITLMGRSVQGAIALAGGAANDPEHPAQQLHRASVVFSVSGQSDRTATAILEALAPSKDAG